MVRSPILIIYFLLKLGLRAATFPITCILSLRNPCKPLRRNHVPHSLSMGKLVIPGLINIYHSGFSGSNLQQKSTKKPDGQAKIGYIQKDK